MITNGTWRILIKIFSIVIITEFYFSMSDKRTYFKGDLIESSKSMFCSFRKSKPNKKELFRTKSESGQVEMSLLPSFHFSQRENKANDQLTFHITFDFTPFRHLTWLLVDENWFSDFYGKRKTFCIQETVFIHNFVLNIKTVNDNISCSKLITSPLNVQEFYSISP